MKKRFHYLYMMMFMVVAAVSCKDDDAALRQELLLSKIVRNEITVMDFIYDGKKLVRANLHSDGVLAHYVIFEYNAEGITESRLYNGVSNAMESKVGFTHGKSGQITKGEIYSEESEFEEVYLIMSFSYNPSGLLKDMRFAFLNEPVYSRQEFGYDGSGQRVQLARYNQPHDSEEYVSLEIEYTPGDRLIPKHWTDFQFLLMTIGEDGYLWDMFNITTHRTSYKSDGTVLAQTRTDVSKLEVNGDGYLTRQTLKSVSLPGLSTQDTDAMMYEYVE